MRRRENNKNAEEVEEEGTKTLRENNKNEEEEEGKQ